MTSRERLLRALSHREPDRVPLDMGNSATSIHREAYRRLQEYLGMDVTEPVIIDRMQQVVRVEERVLQRFAVDTRQLFLKPARPWIQDPDGSWRDEWGVRYRPGAGGRYFDMREHPLPGPTGRALSVTRGLTPRIRAGSRAWQRRPRTSMSTARTR